MECWLRRRSGFINKKGMDSIPFLCHHPSPDKGERRVAPTERDT